MVKLCRVKQSALRNERGRIEVEANRMVLPADDVLLSDEIVASPKMIRRSPLILVSIAVTAHPLL